MVLGGGFKLAALGAGIGIVTALASTRYLASLLYGSAGPPGWSLTKIPSFQILPSMGTLLERSALKRTHGRQRPEMMVQRGYAHAR